MYGCDENDEAVSMTTVSSSLIFALNVKVFIRQDHLTLNTVHFHVLFIILNMPLQPDIAWHVDIKSFQNFYSPLPFFKYCNWDFRQGF